MLKNNAIKPNLILQRKRLCASLLAARDLKQARLPA